MPFNQANPSDSEKIRRLGIVIRPNWKAIEEGSENDANPNKLKYWAINLYSRDDIPSAPGNDAPQVDDGIAWYAKTDADSGLPEIFIRHEDSTVTQMSKYPANIAPIGRTSNGETFLAGGLLLKYADLGSVTSGTYSYLWEGTGSSLELGLTDFPNNCFQVVLGRYSSSSGNAGYVSNVTTSGFDLTSGNNSGHYVIAIGN